MPKPATKRTYSLYTYDDIWDEKMKKLDYTDEEIRKIVESRLQMFAWGDILEGIEKDIEFEHNPPPEFRKFMDFIDSRKE